MKLFVLKAASFEIESDRIVYKLEVPKRFVGKVVNVGPYDAIGRDSLVMLTFGPMVLNDDTGVVFLMDANRSIGDNDYPREGDPIVTIGVMDEYTPPVKKGKK